MNNQNDNLLQIKAFDEICDCIFNDDKSPEVHAQNMKTIYASLFQSKESRINQRPSLNWSKVQYLRTRSINNDSHYLLETFKFNLKNFLNSLKLI